MNLVRVIALVYHLAGCWPTSSQEKQGSSLKVAPGTIPITGDQNSTIHSKFLEARASAAGIASGLNDSDWARRLEQRLGRSQIIFDHQDYPANEAYFDPITPVNVSALLNTSALLHCYVRKRYNETVAWIRTRDLHLLTVGKYTYTTDQRFSAMHDEDTGDWLLLIERVSLADMGTYECQISTNPLKILAISLKVLAPETVVIGGPELHVGVSSTINLTCLAKNMIHPPPNMTWYKDDEVITYNSQRRGVSVLMEKGSKATKSSLILLDAKLTDAANYTCAPFDGIWASTIVHVIEGQLSAGLQHGNGAMAFQKGQKIEPASLLVSIVIGYLSWTGLLLRAGDKRRR